MKFLIFLLLAGGFTIDPGKIGQVNTAKAEAKKAYLAGDYKTAIEKYRYLTDSLGVNEEEVNMNLANAYFETKDSVNAPSLYQSLTRSGNSKTRSLASQQLGVAANRQGKFEEALNHFKQSLKADPSNEDARYNFEMVKKKMAEKKKQEEKDKQNQDQKKDQDKENKEDQKDKKDEKKDQKDKKDQENKDKKDKEDQEKKDQENKEEKEKKDKEQKEKEDKEQKENKDKKDIPPSVSEKLKNMQMSEEKAKMILEAMKNQEIQYLQQNKRKATKPKDKGKPDW
jgi:Ca-activated chloride channel family protein